VIPGSYDAVWCVVRRARRHVHRYQSMSARCTGASDSSASNGLGHLEPDTTKGYPPTMLAHRDHRRTPLATARSPLSR
jgi:hypothetical protein